MDHGREAIGEVSAGGARLLNAAGPSGFMALVVAAHVVVGIVVGFSWLMNAIQPVIVWALRIPALWLGFPRGTANTIHVLGPSLALAVFVLPFAVWAYAISKGRRFSRHSHRVTNRKLAICASVACVAATHSGLPILLARAYSNPGIYPIPRQAAPLR